MEFGEGFVVSSACVTASASKIGDNGGFGSGLLKPQGEVVINERNSCEGQHQMLSFFSPNLHNTPPFPYYHHTSTRATGMNHSVGTLSGLKLPFTPSQWMELEHQALIYKYITSNVPIPSYLLNPIRKAFESAGFSTFPTQRSNPFGWGAFHLGFSSSDLEPGRCRRTDGKKWRCSREAVVDQKYCERHMNRGRHRSRKPVEGQSGRASSGATTTINKPATPVTSTAPVAPGTASTLSLSHPHQLANLQEPDIHVLSNFNRSIPEKGPLQEFGLVCSDSLINPLNQSSSLIHCRSFGDSDRLDDHDNKLENHSFRQFMDVWPKEYSDRTQLSISVPMAEVSNFMPSALSTTSSKLQRSSQELEMGLRVPIPWEPSIAGPLGEVVHSTRKLNMKHNLDNSSHTHLAASPTGVLQGVPLFHHQTAVLEAARELKPPST